MVKEESMENQGFRVNDQRQFNPDGSSKSGEAVVDDIEKTAEEVPPKDQMSSSHGMDAPESTNSAHELPADFPTLILSLASSAQSALGIAPNPLTGKSDKNLVQAKHAIDLLGVLQEKTQGNLSAEEEKLLQAILTDLRMRFVEAK